MEDYISSELSVPFSSENWFDPLEEAVRVLSSPLKKASLTGFHATAKHIAAKAVSPSSETMRTI